MFNEFDPSTCKFGSGVVEAGAYFREPATNPEALPIHLSTAHNVADLDDLQERYNQAGFCYNRYRNPNRTALNDLTAYVEGAKASLSFNAGMAAISAAIISNTKAGDHIVSGDTLYGESLEIFTKITAKYGVDYTFVNACDLDAVKAAMRPNTVMVYTETISNPVIAVPDIQGLADIAHANNALLIVDNTFMTGALFRPLDFGADIVVNSLTKFFNGHSDATVGALGSNDPALVKKAFDMQQLLGNQASPFDSWLACRGARTLDLRVKKQSDNACALAKLFASYDFCTVYHPSLEANEYHEIATKQFGQFYGPMLSVVFPEDREKMNKFMRALHFCHYAMTLGGYRSSMSYPPMSSHSDLSREERYAMGITDGLLRFSCGIEDTEDLVADFKQAIEAAYC